MNRQNIPQSLLTGKSGPLLLVAVLISLLSGSCMGSCGRDREQQARPTPAPTLPAAQPAVATVNPASNAPAAGAAQTLDSTASLLSGRFSQLNPGVVNIQTLVSGGNEGAGLGAGSGFVLDGNGHIVTNNHVVDGARRITVIFFNGQQENAEVVGLDDDSDLAIVKVESLPEGVHPLPLADSNQVQVGDWAIAVGNPFGLGSSMTLGIVSAVGRSIPPA
jgi:2-alkenal reductase